MAAFPAMPLYTDAYLADTRHLTTEEHGAYLLLLMCAWRGRECQLPDDNKSLARITGLSPTRWRRIRPGLEPFFEIGHGWWRQKKLLTVYGDVAARVARNRANGARGGRARTVKRQQSSGDNAAAPTGPRPGENTDKGTEDGIGKWVSKTTGQSKATKTKPKPSQRQPVGLSVSVSAFAPESVPESAPESVSEPEPSSACEAVLKEASAIIDREGDTSHWRQLTGKACGPDTRIDDTVIHFWRAADVCLEKDVLPTIEAIKKREFARTGALPLRLGYYRDAVIEAANNRRNAVRQGRASVPRQPVPRSVKQEFEPGNPDHWRMLLGDPGSRFRGDYMAQNWFVSAEHPVFRECSLGPNPRFDLNPAIPVAIYAQYGRAWCWHPSASAG